MKYENQILTTRFITEEAAKIYKTKTVKENKEPTKSRQSWNFPYLSRLQ